MTGGVCPDWIEQMVVRLDDPQVSGVKGVYRTRQRELVARFVQLEYEDRYRRMADQETIDNVDTYQAGYRRRALLEARGFDTRHVVGEDQELSFRLAKAGQRLVFQPTAWVYHQHPATLAAYVRRKYGVGYWKVLVGASHPDKLWRDSHTPQLLKAQIVLASCIVLGAAAAWLWPSGLWLAVAALGLLLVTTAPFCARAWHADREVAVVAPWLLVVRAFSIGAGFAVSIVVRLAQRLLRSS